MFLSKIKAMKTLISQKSNKKVNPITPGERVMIEFKWNSETREMTCHKLDNVEAENVRKKSTL